MTAFTGEFGIPGLVQTCMFDPLLDAIHVADGTQAIAAALRPYRVDLAATAAAQLERFGYTTKAIESSLGEVRIADRGRGHSNRRSVSD